MKNTITGQEIINNHVKCAKCGILVDIHVCYYDPYFKKGKQVHKECLSTKRKKEIEEYYKGKNII